MPNPQGGTPGAMTPPPAQNPAAGLAVMPPNGAGAGRVCYSPGGLCSASSRIPGSRNGRPTPLCRRPARNAGLRRRGHQQSRSGCRSAGAAYPQPGYPQGAVPYAAQGYPGAGYPPAGYGYQPGCTNCGYGQNSGGVQYPAYAGNFVRNAPVCELALCRSLWPWHGGWLRRSWLWRLSGRLQPCRFLRRIVRWRNGIQWRRLLPAILWMPTELRLLPA